MALTLQDFFTVITKEREQVLFSMAVENVGPMQEHCLKHFN